MRKEYWKRNASELARVAYVAYVIARTQDEDAEPEIITRWVDLRPECRDAWMRACESVEDSRPLAAVLAGDPIRLEDE